jgi:hypothetical protein
MRWKTSKSVKMRRYRKRCLFRLARRVWCRPRAACTVDTVGADELAGRASGYAWLAYEAEVLDAKERVRQLQKEIKELSRLNETYSKKRTHTRFEIGAHQKRELRLQQIINELTQLGKLGRGNGTKEK